MAKIYIANDHAGIEMKQALVEWASLQGHDVINLGSDTEASVDYPDYSDKLVNALRHDRESFGVLICASGIGMSIAANRHKHILAALCHTPELARLARSHNHANVLCLASKIISKEDAQKILDVFLKTPPEGGRHQRRVNKMIS